MGMLASFLNSQGGFARLLDPTVDLREVNAPLLSYP